MSQLDDEAGGARSQYPEDDDDAGYFSHVDCWGYLSQLEEDPTGYLSQFPVGCSAVLSQFEEAGYLSQLDEGCRSQLFGGRSQFDESGAGLSQFDDCGGYRSQAEFEFAYSSR